jgi:hypothetical protein
MGNPHQTMGRLNTYAQIEEEFTRTGQNGSSAHLCPAEFRTNIPRPCKDFNAIECFSCHFESLRVVIVLAPNILDIRKKLGCLDGFNEYRLASNTECSEGKNFGAQCSDAQS